MFTYSKLLQEEVKKWTPVSKSSVLLKKHAKLMGDHEKRWPAYLKLYNNAEALKRIKRGKKTQVKCRTRTVELVENQQKETSLWRSDKAKFLFINGIGLRPKLSWEGLAKVNVGAPDSFDDLAYKLQLQGFRRNAPSSISDQSDLSEVATTASTEVVDPSSEDDWGGNDMKKEPGIPVVIPSFERSYPKLRLFRVSAVTEY